MGFTGVRLMEERWADYLSEFPPNWLTKPGWETYDAWRHPDPATGYRRMAHKAGFRVIYAKVTVAYAVNERLFIHSFIQRMTCQFVIHSNVMICTQQSKLCPFISGRTIP